MQEQLSDFIAQHERRIEPYREYVPSLGARAVLFGPAPEENGAASALRSVLGNRDDFSRIRTYAHSSDVRDPLLRRQAALLYRLYLDHLVEPALEEGMRTQEENIRTEIGGFRCNMGSGPLGWHAVWDLFRHHNDISVRREAWNKLGDLADHLAPMIQELVALRNRSARSRGFKNHHELSHTILELDGLNLAGLLEETREPMTGRFQHARSDLEKRVASRYETRVGMAGPWHFEHPLRLLVPWDRIGEGSLVQKRTVNAVAAFLRRRGLAVSSTKLKTIVGEMAPRSTSRDGPAAVAEVARVLLAACDVLFAQHASSRIPASLRRSPHRIMTHALWYLLLDELATAPILDDSLGLDGAEVARLRAWLRANHERELLVVARHGAVIANFEAGLYHDPGQDLTTAYWDLLSTWLQIEDRPNHHCAMWAVIPEILTPCGAGLERVVGALAAAQIQRALPPAPRGTSPLMHPEAADVVREKLLEPAASVHWNDTVKRISGEPLIARPFIEHLRAPRA